MKITHALLALAALVLPAFAQQPDTLEHSIAAPSVGAQPGAQLGASVATEGSYTIVGAPLDDIGGDDCGAVKVFDSVNGGFLMLLPNPAPGAARQFGASVAISGTRVVVGARYSNAGAINAGSAYVYDLNSGTPTVPVVTLHNPDPTLSDEFGTSVAISGTRLIVGAPNDDTGVPDGGTAYVYDLSSGTPAVPVATLNNPSPEVQDHFGFAVAISGFRVVVGAYADDTGAGAAGSAYVFELNSATPSAPVATLHNPDPAAGDVFAYSLAISGNLVVVGAHGDDTGANEAGCAYVYDLSMGPPMGTMAILHNPNPTAFDRFGESVAISGLRVVVGVRHHDPGASNAGRAYVYNLGSGTPTVPEAVLDNPSPGVDDKFGTGVAIDEARVVVGTPFDDTAAIDAGGAYAYDLSSGTPSVPVATLNQPSPVTGDHFGTSVAISGSLMVVGAPEDDTGAADTGSVYVYDLSSGTPTVPMMTLNNPAPEDHDGFGNAVAIFGTRVVVGAPSDDARGNYGGSAYVYDLSSGTPTDPIATLNKPSATGIEEFGSSVAISAAWVMVGAPYDGAAGVEAGSVYIFNLNSETPTAPAITLNNPSPTPAFDLFGEAVAISGARAVVGARDDDTGAPSAGSAYVYDLNSGTPTVPVATLHNPSPANYDFFGDAVAISGTRVVVGAYADDTGTSDAGSAYVYDLSSGTPAVPTATLHNPSPANYDFFGYALAIAGSRAVVANLSGEAYVYDLNSATPAVPVAVLTDPRPVSGAGFGSSAAIDGTTVAITAPFDNAVATNKGFAYTFAPAALNIAVAQATALIDGVSSVAFGNVTLNSSQALTFTITNPGASELTDLAVTKSEAGAEDFTVSALSDTSIPAGPGTVTFMVTFSPTSSGTKTATLHIASNVTGSRNPFDILLTGTGNTRPTAPDSSATATTSDMKTITLHSLVTDVDGDIVMITDTAPDSHLIVNSISGLDVTFTPSSHYAGDAILGYTVSDGRGGTASGTITVTISDNEAPAINAHVNVSALAPDLGGIVVDYAAATATDNVTANPTITYSQNPGTIFPLGTTTVTVNAEDAAGNDATPVTFTVTVRLQAPVNTPAITSGEAAPGAIANSAGLPVDAEIASFNTPATDDDGDLAFIAKWTSTTGPVKKGTGLFLNDECLAVVGGDVPNLTGAKWKSFTDPVVDGGSVATIARLTGVPAASASGVFSNTAGSTTLELIARAGDIAPGFDGNPPAGGAKFKSFKAVSIDGGAVAFLAQLTGGTLAEKAAPASDLGLWLKQGTNPLQLVMREGREVEVAGTNRRLKTMTSFVPGSGSPGAGRGWLSQPYGPAVLVLGAFTDKSQAVLSVFGGGGFQLLSRTGVAGTGDSPSLPDATFSSYGLPAVNDRYTTAFLASLRVGLGEVTKADARGVFVSNGSGGYVGLARVGQPAGNTGANFSVLKDPVLSSDDGVAFPATIKGGTVKGVAMQTLWWKKDGEPLALLAQGGARPGPDLPAEAQWKAFTSLAIAANRGPIFAATLVPKKGGVLATSAVGVWACDFNGVPRLLFRTGVPDAIIPGKTLKSFTLLKASVGSTGVTRSFNDQAQVVWLATFTDKTTAIITTEVP